MRGGIKKTADIAAGGSVVFPPQENSKIKLSRLFAACAAQTVVKLAIFNGFRRILDRFHIMGHRLSEQSHIFF